MALILNGLKNGELITDYLEIIQNLKEILNNFLYSKPNFSSNLSLKIIKELQSNLVVPKNYNLIIIPEGILFEPHIQTFLMLLGIWGIEEFFYYLFWIDYIRPLREKIKCWIKNKLKKL